MPFYIVTYTALVEAEDEVDAAEKVVANFQAEPRMTFTVKLDENTVKHVSVTRQAGVTDDIAIAQSIVDGDAGIPEPIPVRKAQPAAADAGRPARSFGVIGAIFLALSFAACGLAGMFHFASFPSF